MSGAYVSIYDKINGVLPKTGPKPVFIIDGDGEQRIIWVYE